MSTSLLRSCRTLRLVILFLLGVALNSPATAANEAKPIKTTVGIYVNQIYGVSLKDNKFTVDFYVWFRHADGISPLDTFEVMNGRVESKTGVVKKKIGDINYSACRVVATINQFWDISKYPLDRHRLSIQIEDSDNDEDKLIFTADAENSGINASAQVRGWQVAGTSSDVSRTVYTTNYGDISLPTNSESSYSRYTFYVDAARAGFGQFFKLFTVLFLAVLVAYLSFFVLATSGQRFALGTGALFAAAASSFVVSSSLPESSVPTLADYVQITTIVFIFASLAISTISMKLVGEKREQEAKRLDRIGAIAYPVLYMLFLLWVLLQ